MNNVVPFVNFTFLCVTAFQRKDAMFFLTPLNKAGEKRDLSAILYANKNMYVG